MNGVNRTRTMVINGMIAAIYVVIYFIAPQLAYGPIQARFSEGLNHLNVFDKRYKWGVIAGVFISNFYGFATGLGWFDVVFGTLHTLISFLICDFIFKKVTNVKIRMSITCIVFSLLIFIVAFELWWAFELPFLETYGTLILSEFVMLAITAPIMFAVNNVVHFKAQLTK